MSEMSVSEQKKEDWMNSKWRPMMGWMYMLVCTADFVVFPVLWSLIQALHGGQVTNQWNPITLQGAGLFHVAMGAVLGVAAFGRTQEKMAGVNNGGASQSTTFSVPTPAPSSITPTTAPSGYSQPSSTGGFGSSSFGSAPVATTPSGKAIVPIGNEPEL